MDFLLNQTGTKVNTYMKFKKKYIVVLDFRLKLSKKYQTKLKKNKKFIKLKKQTEKKNKWMIFLRRLYSNLKIPDFKKSKINQKIYGMLKIKLKTSIII